MKRRYATISQQGSTELYNHPQPNIHQGVIYEYFSILTNIEQIYDIEKFIISDQTYITDPFIAVTVENATHTTYMEILRKDSNGSISHLYIVEGVNVTRITQRESFHNRIILLVNTYLKTRGYPDSHQITDVTQSILIEINRALVQNFLKEQLH